VGEFDLDKLVWGQIPLRRFAALEINAQPLVDACDLFDRLREASLAVIDKPSSSTMATRTVSCARESWSVRAATVAERSAAPPWVSHHPAHLESPIWPWSIHG
jgi:hypothetical protein